MSRTHPALPALTGFAEDFLAAQTDFVMCTAQSVVLRFQSASSFLGFRVVRFLVIAIIQPILYRALVQARAPHDLPSGSMCLYSIYLGLKGVPIY